jgi:hypothetical protein
VGRANHLAVSALRLRADTVTLSSLPAGVTGISVMTADIFGKNLQTESDRIGVDGCGG